MTHIQKAKEIIKSYLDFELPVESVSKFEDDMLNESFDEWAATPSAAALLSGDWKDGQWEYSVRPALADWDLTDMGKQGWQLCAVNDKYYYFKRPLPEPHKP